MISADAILKSIATSGQCTKTWCGWEITFLSIMVEQGLYLNLRIERTGGDWRFQKRATFPYFDFVQHRGPDIVHYRFGSTADTFSECHGTRTPITDAMPFVDAVEEWIESRSAAYQAQALNTFKRKIPESDIDEVEIEVSPENAEIASLKAEVQRLRAMTSTTMGVGTGGGNLFVHGDYDSIKAAQQIVFRCEALAADNVRLRDAATSAIAASSRMFSAVESFLNANRSEHLIVRLNDEEMAAVDEMKAAIADTRCQT